MLDSIFEPGSVLFFLLLAFLLLFLIQISYFSLFLLIFVRKSKQPGSTVNEGVSVVICARNEYNKLRENLPLVLTQDYPDYEVIVVNHTSDDDTSSLLTSLADQYHNLKIVEIKENLNFFDGKKFPLSIGIKSATFERILLTDADCRPASPEWITKMNSGFHDEKKIILGYGAYEPSRGLLNRLIRYDTAHIALQYLSFALAGIPYMGVGRNMAYCKSLFYEHKGFTSHYKVNSGDDDLFVNRAANSKNTVVVDDPGSFTYSVPKKSFTEWWKQKKRHLSTARYYRWLHKILLGLYSSTTLFFYTLFALLMLFSLKSTIFVVLVVFVLRMSFQLFIFRKALKRLKEKGIWMLVPLFEILMILFNFALAISVLTTKKTKWK